MSSKKKRNKHRAESPESEDHDATGPAQGKESREENPDALFALDVPKAAHEDDELFALDEITEDMGSDDLFAIEDLSEAVGAQGGAFASPTLRQGEAAPTADEFAVVDDGELSDDESSRPVPADRAEEMAAGESGGEADLDRQADDFMNQLLKKEEQGTLRPRKPAAESSAARRGEKESSAADSSPNSRKNSNSSWLPGDSAEELSAPAEADDLASSFSDQPAPAWIDDKQFPADLPDLDYDESEAPAVEPPPMESIDTAKEGGIDLVDAGDDELAGITADRSKARSSASRSQARPAAASAPRLKVVRPVPRTRPVFKAAAAVLLLAGGWMTWQRHPELIKDPYHKYISRYVDQYFGDDETMTVSTAEPRRTPRATKPTEPRTPPEPVVTAPVLPETPLDGEPSSSETVTTPSRIVESEAQPAPGAPALVHSEPILTPTLPVSTPSVVVHSPEPVRTSKPSSTTEPVPSARVISPVQPSVRAVQVGEDVPRISKVSGQAQINLEAIVELSNGYHFRGRIKRIRNEQLTLADGAAEYTFDLSEVRVLSSSEPEFRRVDELPQASVTLLNGQRLRGRLLKETEQHVVLVFEAGQILVPRGDIRQLSYSGRVHF